MAAGSVKAFPAIRDILLMKNGRVLLQGLPDASRKWEKRNLPALLNQNWGTQYVTRTIFPGRKRKSLTCCSADIKLI